MYVLDIDYGLLSIEICLAFEEAPNKSIVSLLRISANTSSLGLGFFARNSHTGHLG